MIAALMSGSLRISGGTWFRVLGVRRGVAVISLSDRYSGIVLGCGDAHPFGRWWFRHRLGIHLVAPALLLFVFPRSASWVGAGWCCLSLGLLTRSFWIFGLF